MDFILIAGVYLVVLFFIIVFNHGAHKNDPYDYGFDEPGSSPDDTLEGLPNFEYLPILVADDDFIEHLAEMCFDETIELDEAFIEWDDWAAENVE